MALVPSAMDPSYHAQAGLCPGVPGDILAVQRGHCLHYALNAGDNCIIHRANPKLDGGDGVPTSAQDVMIIKQAFNHYAKPGERWWVDNMFDNKWTPLPPGEVVGRAHSKLGERGYSLVSENCEHFVTWCRYDHAVSVQVDAAVNTVASEAGTRAVQKGAHLGAIAGRAGSSFGASAGRVIGSVVGATLDRNDAAEAQRMGVPPPERRREQDWATKGRDIGEKSIGTISAVGGAAVGGVWGFISGAVSGANRVADQHNVDRNNFTGVVGEVIGASTAPPRQP